MDAKRALYNAQQNQTSFIHPQTMCMSRYFNKVYKNYNISQSRKTNKKI